jgi:electron transfer flavoprotein beta subunit
MHIVTLMKRVPTTELRVKIAADGKSLDLSGVEHVVNPYDEYAVEEALRTREKHGGDVTVVCLGPAEAQKELKTCLALGVDRAVLVQDAAPARDSAAAAQALAAALKTIPHDVIFCGKLAVDDQNHQIGPRLAELLGLPVVTAVSKLELQADRARARSETDAGSAEYEVRLPAIFTLEKGINEPRYPSLKGIMAAKARPVATVPAADAPSRLTVLKLELPPKRAGGKIVGKGPEAVPELLRLLREEARLL